MPSAKDSNAELVLQVGVTTEEAVVLREDAGVPAVHTAAVAEAVAVQSQVPPGTVWVTESTYRQAEPDFEWTRLGAEPGAGPLYQPVVPITAPAEHAVGGLRAPLVGRVAELQRLNDAIARVSGGIGGIVTLVGAAGIGKSRLVAEARSQVEGPKSKVGGGELEVFDSKLKGDDAPSEGVGVGSATDGVRWVEGRWASYAEGMAYSGWQEMLRRLLELPEACNRTACVALRDQIAALCPDRAETLYPYLAAVGAAGGCGDVRAA